MKSRERDARAQATLQRFEAPSDPAHEQQMLPLWR